MLVTRNLRPELKTNRRRLIERMGLAIGAAAVLGAGVEPRRAAAATTKLPPQDAGYQPSPKGKARCEVCANWQAPNGCKVVAGSISPTGWCSLFAPRP
jgi:hypothetical protein